jgi:F-type H+-transporting ATPase subunit delta
MAGANFDTGKQHLAGVYAKALLGAAQAAGNVDGVLSEFGDLISQVFDRSPAFEAMLASPRVEESDKLAILDKALAGKISTTLLNFVKIMARHGRLDCIRETEQVAQRMYNELRGRREVYVTTAEPIGPETVEAIAARLRTALKADVDLRLDVDSSLIGGLVVRVGDTLYDGSVANQLARFREEALIKATQEMRASLNKYLTPA